MTNATVRPRYCNFPSGCRTGLPPVFVLTFVSAPVQARGERLPGMTTEEGSCRAHADLRKNQVRSEGGELVAVEEWEPLPDEAPLLEPVGLDAVAPSPEPKKIRVPRRRKRGG